MERFRTIDVSVINQKENNPSLARDEKDRNTQDGNATLNHVPEAGGRYTYKYIIYMVIVISHVCRDQFSL